MGAVTSFHLVDLLSGRVLRPADTLEKAGVRDNGQESCFTSHINADICILGAQIL